MGKLYLTEESGAPTTPPATKVVIYPKADGLLYWKDDNGIEYKVTYAGITGFYNPLTGVAGTNVITATGNPTVTALQAGQVSLFIAANNNTAAATLQIDATAAKNIYKKTVAGLVALSANDIVAGTEHVIAYDGVQYNLINPLSAISAKGAIKVGQGSGVESELTVGSDGQVAHADSSQAKGLIYIDNPSRPNLLINPNWQLDQINEGALYTISGAAPVLGPDGWTGNNGNGAGVFKIRTLADPENAALKCLEITCTTVDASIAAGDIYRIYTAIEGYDLAALMAGTSSVLPITIQFKFKTSVTGIYGIAIQNSALNRRYIGTINVVDTLEHEYSVTLTMDTTGTWLYTNGVGLYLMLTLAAGSSFQGTAGAWAAGAETTTSSQVNFMSSTANIAYLKRIQVIPGTLVQAYKPADIQKELAKAQRYQPVARCTGSGTFEYLGLSMVIAGNTTMFSSFKFPVVTRIKPTGIIVSAVGNIASLDTAGTSRAASGFVFSGSGNQEAVSLHTMSGGTFNAGDASNWGFLGASATSADYIAFTGARLS